MGRILASRIFRDDDQTGFAALSGDYNPMHVDLIAARRIGAGAQVVHGVHNLLWCLDCVAAALPHLPPLQSIKVNFDSFVTINETVDILLVQSDTGKVRVEAQVRGMTALTALLVAGTSRAAVPAERPGPTFAPPAALAPDDAGIAGLCGTVPFAAPPPQMEAAFPNAARLMGTRGLAALGACTRLIGMVCPGLHSIFNKLALEAASDDGLDAIGFRVTSANITHRRVVCSAWGGGWVGTLTSMIRHQPTAQPSMAELATHVAPGEFRDKVALVVGGSRGIGEVVAKLVASGGGRAIITYAAGEADAERVASEIRDGGGLCEAMKLDVTLPIAPQLARNQTVVNQLFYFATPMIGGRQGDLFDPERLTSFLHFYVYAFYECCQALRDRAPHRLDILYPSSVFVADRPRGLTEYAMAKAAGEQLCQDMNKGSSDLRTLVCRLPRLATDQNAGQAAAGDGPSICKTMLPLIRQML